MRPMEIQPECYACLEQLVHLVVDLSSSDKIVKKQAAAAALEILGREFPRPGAIPALIASRFQRAIREVSGTPDPFASRKAAATAFLARMHRRLGAACGQDLASLLELAAAGNAIDFFRAEDEVGRELLSGVEFEVSHLAELRAALAGSPGLLLYLADNAGEQFFDLPLVANLRSRGWRVVYVVKGGPVQNDLTREDLRSSGLGTALEPVADTGASTVGLDLSEASPGFRAQFAAARLILAKGMGHFETMSHLGDPRVFFLLQAKCTAVAAALGVPPQAFVLARSPAISLDNSREAG